MNRHYPELSRLLFLGACVLLVIAALAAGAVLGGVNWLPWMLGGLASIALAWCVA